MADLAAPPPHYDAEVETLLQEAIAAAQEAPYPSADDMLTDVYVQER